MPSKFLVEPMILIADDNQEMRRMIRDLVADLDPEVIECADGGAAIAAYDEYQPDFVLMDIHMTPVDGLTATREILGRHPDARIIAVTQHQDARTRARVKAMGMWAFVGKDDLMSLRSLISPTGEHRSAVST